jgi:hypothetical protein
LLADAQENKIEIASMIELHRRRADIFVRLERAALDSSSAMPSPDELSDVACRWFIQPVAPLQRATYAELVSAGKLTLLRDEELRLLLAREDFAHAVIDRMDVTVPAVQHAGDPIDAHRSWYIDGERTRCRFDAIAMRADKRVPSAVAQLYRDQQNHSRFRQDELLAVRAVESRLLVLLDLPPAAEQKAEPAQTASQ